MNVVALLRPFVTWRNLNWFSFLHVEYHFPSRQIIFHNPFCWSGIEVARACYNSWFHNHVKSDSDQTTIILTFTAELITFYTIFYIALAALFAICMKGLLMTINYESPKWKLSESLIGINPGLGFRPISQDVDQGSLIWYDASNQTQIIYWTKILDGFMQGWFAAIFLSVYRFNWKKFRSFRIQSRFKQPEKLWLWKLAIHRTGV